MNNKIIYLLMGLILAGGFALGFGARSFAVFDDMSSHHEKNGGEMNDPMMAEMQNHMSQMMKICMKSHNENMGA